MDNTVFNEKNAITMELERREGVGKGGGGENENCYGIC